MNDTEVTELRAYLKALTPAQLGMSVPKCSIPVGAVYIRHNPEQPPAPASLDGYVIRLRTGDQLTKERTVADLVSLFGVLWHGEPLLAGASLRPAAPVKGLHKPADPKEKWDRLVTPRYTVDVVELTAEKLAVFLGGPVAIAAVLKQRTEEAVAKVKAESAATVEPTVHGPFHTPVQMYLKCDAFILEAFAYTEAAGYVGD